MSAEDVGAAKASDEAESPRALERKGMPTLLGGEERQAQTKSGAGRDQGAAVTHAYELTADDMGRRRICRSDREGLLATDDAALLPQLVRAHLGRRFFSFRTNGDGGCGLHALWGRPNGAGELEYPGGQAAGRAAVSAAFARITPADLDADDCPHLEHVKTSLWAELTVPAATREMDAGNESLIFWETMRRHDPVLAGSVVSFCTQRRNDDIRRQHLRSAYRQACNAVFRVEFDVTIVRPLATQFAHPEFPVDNAEGSRYASLFHGHGVEERDTRREGFLQYMGMGPNRAYVLSTLRRHLDGFMPGDAEYDVLSAWIDAYEAVSAPIQDAPPNFVTSAWAILARAITDNNYYFSNAELLLYARLAQSNVVVTTHRDRRFVTVGYVMASPDAGQVTYISLEDNG